MSDDLSADLAGCFLSSIDFQKASTPKDLEAMINGGLRTLLPDPVHSQASSNLLEHVGLTSGGPTGTLGLLRLVKEGTFSLDADLRLRARIPTQLLGDDLPTDLTFDGPVGDSHLHSGGVSSAIDVLSSLLPILPQLSPNADLVEGRDTSGNRVSLDPLVLALGFTSLALDQPQALRAPSFITASEKSGTQDFWASSVRAADSRSTQALAELWASFEVLADLTGLVPSIERVLQEIQSWVHHGYHPSEKLLAPAVGAMAIIHACLCLDPGSTLDEFAQRFKLMSMLRGRLSSDGHGERLKRQVRGLVFNQGLNRLELRKNIALPGEGAVSDAALLESDLLGDIREHLHAFQSVMGDPRAPAAASMPISFRRGAQPLSNEPTVGEVGLLFPIGEYLTAAETIVSVWQSRPSVAVLTGALDVVGREADTPNWVFAVVFERVAELCRQHAIPTPVFAVHAGEQYSSPLNGLRRIGELSDFRVSVARIGHGLALGDSGSATVDLSSSLEALHDVVWLGEQTGSDSVQVVAMELAAEVFGPGCGFDWTDLAAWRKSLFDLGYLRKVGLVQPALPLAERTFRPTTSRPGMWDISDTVSRMVVASVAGVSTGGVTCNSNASISPDLRRRIVEAASSQVGVARNKLLDSTTATLEACPTSNVLLGNKVYHSNHPLWSWHARGLDVTISSDDPGLFATSARRELGLLRVTDGAAPKTQEVIEALRARSHEAASGWIDAEDFPKLLRSAIFEVA